mmetsp:Transcript_23802/g.42105  ORF Transcript_23802/g.42105 Transcript_23802/m.42105 type:complete len:194 (-) Transcript_23802:594-1175(-)
MNFPVLRLSNHLLREARHEAKQLPPLEFFESFLKKSKFIFKSSPESSRLLLFKPVEDYLMEVEYFSRYPLIAEKDFFADLLGDEEEESEEQVICDNTSSTIVFTRKGWKFMADCATLNSSTQIARLLTTDQDLNCEYHLYFNPTNSIYKSAFANLSSEVPAELGQFIELTSVWHEHEQYKAWLLSLNEFILKN